MDKTKIDWCDSTWNPVTGCLHGCEYCYARRIAKRFSYEGETLDAPAELQRTWVNDCKGSGAGNHVLRYQVDLLDDGRKVPYPFGFEPTFHKYRLNDYISKKGRNIFVCSMADLFGDWVPDSWIKEVFDACKKAPQHNYLFLTKNPDRYIELETEKELSWADNFWFGSSVTKLSDRYTWFTGKKSHWFLSVEPMLEDLGQMDKDAQKPEWVIVGAETGQRKDKVVPDRKWIENLLTECRKYEIPLFMKSSLSEIWGKPLIQEFPEELIK